MLAVPPEFSSKKFRVALIAFVTYALGSRLGVDSEILDKLFQALLMWVGAQGLADVGKEAEKIRSAASPSNGAPPSTPASLPTSPSPAATTRLSLLVVAVLCLSVVLPTAGCGASSRELAGRIATSLVECEAVRFAPLVEEIKRSCGLPDGRIDFACSEGAAIGNSFEVGGCALLRLATRPDPAPTPGSGASTLAPRGGEVADPDALDAFRDFRARFRPGATYRIDGASF